MNVSKQNKQGKYSDVPVLLWGLGLVLLCFFSNSLKAQQDSLKDLELKKNLRSTTSKSKSRGNIYQYLDRARKRFDKNPTRSFEYIEKAFELSVQQKNTRGKAYSYYTMGALNYHLEHYDLSIENYEKALNLFLKIADTDGAYKCYKELGMAYDADKEYQKALNYYLNFKEKAEERKNKEDINTANTLIAAVHVHLGNYVPAESLYKEVLRNEEAEDDEVGIIDAKNNLGALYLERQMTDKAIDYYSSSQELAEKSQDTAVIRNTYQQLGKAYRSQKQYDQELDVRKKSLELSRSQGDKKEETKDQLEIAKVYLDQDNSIEALPYLQNSLQITRELGEIEAQKEVYKGLSDAYAKSGNYDRALENYKEYVALNDSIHKQRTKKLLTAVELSNDLYSKQKRIELLEKDQELREERIKGLEKEQQLVDEGLKRQRTINYALLGGLLTVSFASLWVFRSARQKRLANQMLALKSLRSQMNPHFIFNALNSVNNFISRKEERMANKYLADFSKLMRSVMESSQHDFVSLATEVQILELYLKLEHSRFQKKFDYTFEVAPDVDTDAFEVPPMLIQPYVENAVWHGLRYKEEKGFLRLSLTPEGSALLIVIEDNGIGRKRSQELKTKNQKATTSTGLKNIESRIAIINQLYETKIKVYITDLYEKGDVGTRVELLIPSHQNT